MATRLANQLKRQYDVIINGGGIVGFTFLNMLLKSPYLKNTKVLLVELNRCPDSFEQKGRVQIRSDVEDDGSCFANRVSSITLASKIALENSGVWKTVEPFAKQVKSIHVWNYDFAHKIRFFQTLPDYQRSKVNNPDVIFDTLENNRLTSALLQSIHLQSNASRSILWSSSLTGLSESVENGMIDVTLEDKETGEKFVTSTSLVLGCDGFQSKIRELSQMKTTDIELNKRAVVGTVRLAPNFGNQQNEVAFQKFSAEKDTVAALLPLDDKFSSFVVSAPEDYARHLAETDDETFLREFNRLLISKETPQNTILKGIHEVINTTCDNLGTILSIFGLNTHVDFDHSEPPTLDHIAAGSRSSYPLMFSTTSPRMTAPLPGCDRSQIALLGDSTHRIHPLAGQGLNLGIQDAMELLRQLEHYAQIGERVFSEPNLLSKALKKYELRRQALILPLSAGILAMQNLFLLAPSQILSSVNRCDIVKAASVRIANGM